MNSVFLFYMLVFLQRYGCNGKNVIIENISGNNGSLTSPGYPGNYPNNVNYTWILNTEHSEATVIFTFDVFHIYKYDYYSCTDDFLEIREKDPCCFTAMRRCGRFNSFSLSVKGRLIRITFVSDGLHTATGFSLRWSVSLPASTKSMTTKTTTQTTKTVKDTTKTTAQSKKSTKQATKTKTTFKTTSQKSTAKFNSTKQATLNKNIKKTSAPKTTTITMQSKSVSRTHVYSSKNKPSPTTVITQTPTNEKTTTDVEDNAVILAIGIGVLEITLVAVGICIVKHHRARSSKKSDAIRGNEGKSAHISQKTVSSLDNGYESIPLEHFQGEDIIEEEEGMYVDVPQNVYDTTFERRPHVNTKNDNVYQWY